jgi:hypothetical protein
VKKVAYTPENYQGYLTYNFVDKDPIIDAMRTLIVDVHGALNDSVLAKIEIVSNVKAKTLHGWFFGKTRRPFHASSIAVIRALGKDLRIVDSNVVILPQVAFSSPVNAQTQERIRVRINRPVKKH